MSRKSEIPPDLIGEITESLLKINYDFNINDYLGSGGFSEVYLVTERSTDDNAAAKIIMLNESYNPSQTSLIDSEISLMKKYGLSPHILPCLEYITKQRYVIILTEYCPGGSFAKFVDHYNNDKLDEYFIKNNLRQIVKAIYTLHKNGHIHRDIKPENILIDKHNNIMLADFGMVTESSNQSFLSRTRTCGTQRYLSPEVLNGTAQSQYSDIYSFGLVALELIVGRRSIENTEAMNMSFQKAKNKMSKFSYPEAMMILICTCLSSTPKKRPKAYKILENKWMRLESSRPSQNLNNSVTIQIKSSDPYEEDESDEDMVDTVISDDSQRYITGDRNSSTHHQNTQVKNSGQLSSNTESIPMKNGVTSNVSGKYTKNEYDNIPEMVEPDSDQFHSYKYLLEKFPYLFNRESSIEDKIDKIVKEFTELSTPKYISKIKSIIRDIISLKSLLLYVEDLSQVKRIFWTEISYALLCNFQLNSIQIYECKLKDIALVEMSKSFYYLPQLKEIDFSVNLIEDNGCCTFIKCFKYITNLESLFLHCNKLTDRSLIELSDNVQYVTKLSNLTLDDNEITNRGFQKLCSNLLYLPQLKEISFKGNKGIDDRSIKSICQLLSELKYLNIFRISNTHISDSNLDNLSDRFHVKFV